MGKQVRSEKNFWGGYNHYDEKGKKVGESRPSVWGGYDTYDSNGKKTGTSRPNVWGGLNHYDAMGNKTGTSRPNVWGGLNHYDAMGNKTGSSNPNAFDGYNHYDRDGKCTGTSNITFTDGYKHTDSTEGCYVATCVYGSYDCPEVWTLRRFRDDFLGKSVLGRAFIHTYYAVSPTIVRWFGGFEAFRSFWKKPLDKMVRELSGKGVEDTPYEDKNWR